MCIRTALEASSLCSIPGLAAFTAGVLSVERPKWFLVVLLVTLCAVGVVVIRRLMSSSHGLGGDVPPTQVTAGALLAISFLFSFWCGIAWAAGLGLVKPGVAVAVVTALLAAFVLTFVRRLLAGHVTWARKLHWRMVLRGRAAESVPQLGE